MLEYRDANPRTRAIERARAEALTIEHSNQLARVEIELRALSLIRSHRLARTAKGLRIRLTLIAAATGITCGVFGYWIRVETPAKIQLHVIEREVAVVAALETAPAVAPVNGASSQSAEPAVVLASQAVVPLAACATTTLPSTRNGGANGGCFTV